MTTKIHGQLEIDYDRGVIYFHADDGVAISQFGAVSILRICGLYPMLPGAIDITIRATEPSIIGYSKPN